MGAAVTAAKDYKLPVINFSGRTGDPGNATGYNTSTAWNARKVPHHSRLYAELATNITHQILWSGPPYLPKNIFLNVNFPWVSEACSKAEDFRFVLSRMHHRFSWEFFT